MLNGRGIAVRSWRRGVLAGRGAPHVGRASAIESAGQARPRSEIPRIARGPVEGLRAPKSAGGGGTAGLSNDSSSESESRLRSPRPPVAGVSGSDIPGARLFVREREAGVRGLSDLLGRAGLGGLAREKLVELGDGRMVRIDRAHLVRARPAPRPGGFHRGPSWPADARLSNCGPESLRWRAFSRIGLRVPVPGERLQDLLGGGDRGVEIAGRCRLSAARTSSLSTSTEATRSCRVGVAATRASSSPTSTAAAGFLALSISCRAGANRGSIFRMKSQPITQSSVLPSLKRFSVWRKVERILSRTSLGRDGLPG